jgi:predicted enzyme related to lactoylglutathione lyase
MPSPWFEIYVASIEDSIDFYQELLHLSITPMVAEGEDLTLFALADSETSAPFGALCHMKGFDPGRNSTIVYFEVSRKEGIDDRIKSVGAHIIRPWWSIGDAGFATLINDNEGNVIGLISQD